MGKAYHEIIEEMMSVGEEQILRIGSSSGEQMYDKGSDYRTEISSAFSDLMNFRSKIAFAGMKKARTAAAFRMGACSRQEAVESLEKIRNEVMSIGEQMTECCNYLNHLFVQLDMGDVIDVGQRPGEALRTDNKETVQLVIREIGRITRGNP